MTSKRSKHELKRIVEEAVITASKGPLAGLWFVVDEIEAYGRPPNLLRVWYTLHFFDKGSPYCCGEPGCQLGIGWSDARTQVALFVGRSMNLRHPVDVEFVGAATVYHPGATWEWKGQIQQLR